MGDKLGGKDVVTESQLNDAVDKLIKAAKKKTTKVTPIASPHGGGYAGSPKPPDLDWIKPRFKEFLEPDPGDIDGLITKVKEVEIQLGGNNVDDFDGGNLTSFASGDLDGLDTAKNNVGKWKGTLANNFIKNFLEPMPNVAHNQAAIACVLRKSAEAMRDCYMTGRKNALEIAEKGTEAIEESQGCDVDALLKVLAVAVAVASPLSIPLSGASAGVKLAHASLVSAGGLPGSFAEEGEKVELGGKKVADVLENIKEALDKVEKRIKEEEDEISERLKKSESEISKLLRKDSADNPIISRQPDLAEANREKIRDRLVQTN